MDDKTKKLAAEAVELYKKIKTDTEKLKNLKQKIIDASSGKNTSYAIKLMAGTVRVTKSKKLISYLLDKKRFVKLDIPTKRKLVQNKIIELRFTINNAVYEDLSSKNLVPNELKDLVEAKDRKAFYVSIYLGKKSASKEMTKEEVEQIMGIDDDEDDKEDENGEDNTPDLIDEISDVGKTFSELQEEEIIKKEDNEDED